MSITEEAITEPIKKPLPFNPTPYTCYYPPIHGSNRCDFCPVNYFALCEYNGYKTKELRKSNFEEAVETQEKIDELNKTAKKPRKNKSTNTKKGRGKKK